MKRKQFLQVLGASALVGFIKASHKHGALPEPKFEVKDGVATMVDQKVFLRKQLQDYIPEGIKYVNIQRNKIVCREGQVFDRKLDYLIMEYNHFERI